MKGYYRAKRGKTVAFRPPERMRKRLEQLAERKTRTLADQAEHFVKIGMVVAESVGTDDLDVIVEKLKLPTASLSIIAEQIAGGHIINHSVEPKKKP